jgi:16S rRNA (guanine966-N2)-methyltransferase
MRIIAGIAKGRRLVGPKGDATRPMTDRMKEALFSTLAGRVVDARVVDLYAGSGSLGLEALSRGAASCVFVEKDRRALAVLTRNIEAVGLGGEIVAGDVERFLGASPTVADLAFVDPPYELALASVGSVVEALERILSEEATVVVHRRRGEEPPDAIGGLSLVDRRSYGDAELWRYASTPSGILT